MPWLMQEQGEGASGGDDSEARCHCQGSRLLVLVGLLKKKEESANGALARDPGTGAYLVDDSTMYLAQHWALEFYDAQRKKGAHIHLLGYNANGDVNDPGSPWIPKKAPSAAETVLLQGQPTTLAAAAWSWHTDSHADLAKTIPSCCCFFQEVMIIFHGHQPGVYKFLIESFSKVLAGRPVEKLVLWTCKSSDKFAPAESNKFYQNIAWLVQPELCPCGCQVGVCNAFDPDCKARHCPDGKKPTKILTSGEANGKAVTLSIDPSKANPFGSPDGRLREITVQPEGAGAASDQVTADMGVAGPTIFDGLTCGTDPPAGGFGPPDAAAVKKYKDKFLTPSAVEASKGGPQPYVGPKVENSGCDPTQGCLKGLKCNGPQ